MKNLLKIEEFLLFVLAWMLSQQLGFAGWVFWAWLLAPDAGMVGYLVNPAIGAFTYNLTHHKGIAVAAWLAGVLMSEPALQLTGLVMLGHSSIDRVFGYGLKFSDSFNNTHLGRLK
jgi:hypothetical protein